MRYCFDDAAIDAALERLAAKLLCETKGNTPRPVRGGAEEQKSIYLMEVKDHAVSC